MFRHTVFFRWKAGTPAKAVQKVSAGLATLPAQIPQIKRFEFGPDLELAEDNFSFALVADFDDMASWRVYSQHPAHLEVVSKNIKPILAVRAAVQYTVDG